MSGKMSCDLVTSGTVNSGHEIKARSISVHHKCMFAIEGCVWDVNIVHFKREFIANYFCIIIHSISLMCFIFRFDWSMNYWQYNPPWLLVVECPRC